MDTELVHKQTFVFEFGIGWTWPAGTAGHRRNRKVAEKSRGAKQRRVRHSPDRYHGATGATSQKRLNGVIEEEWG
jgi:hypothetical protein